MKTFKLKAWDERDKKMITWESLCRDPLLLRDSLTIFKIKQEDGSVFSNQAYTKAYDLTLMQYTGQKDANKKEIYENDIVKCGMIKHGVIKYKEDFSAFVIDYSNESQAKLTWCFLDGDGGIEVIGNTFENPELLEMGKYI